MKKRIIFVDDESQILEGLKGRLRRQRKKWDMSFVESGQEALDALESEPFDVIVTDMRMPQMDGAELLKKVHEKHPEVIRIVLSGHAELEIALRALPVAHQFINKPCDAQVLENVVERASNLQLLINSDVVRSIMGEIDTLPSLPRVYSQLVGLFADDFATIDAIARVLKQDMTMCAKLLQVVNSAFFRLSRKITKIEDAVSYLGFSAIKQLALTVEVFGQTGNSSVIGGLSTEVLQKHSLLTASICKQMFDDKQKQEDAFIAGLLHDIGKLLMAMKFPKYLDKAVAASREQTTPMHIAEEKTNGVTHAEIGAYLLGLWGLPYPIVEAVAFHHFPARVAGTEFDILAAVHLADSLASEQMEPIMNGIEPVIIEIDQDYLDSLGVGHKMDEWREMALKQIENVNS